MRRSVQLVSLVFSLVFVANTALAQKKPKGKKKNDDGPSAAQTWTDPTENEKSDKGPYRPQSEAEEPPPDAPKPKTVDPGRKRDKVDVFGQIVIGFGQVPLNNPNYDDAPSGKGTAIGFQLGGRYDFTPAFSGGLRIPITTASVKQSNNKNLSTTAFGSPELFGEYRLSLSRYTTVPIGFGVGIPLAEGNLDAQGTDTAGVQKDLVNRFADATTGWRDSELFQPKRVPIILGAGVRHERQDWELHGDIKMVFLPGFGNKVAAQPGNVNGTYKINGFAFREVTSFGGSYNFLDKPLLYGALDFALVWTPAQTYVFNSTDNVTKPSALQAVLEPKVGARFGAISPSVSYIAPLGGRLGTTGVGGIRLHVDALF